MTNAMLAALDAGAADQDHQQAAATKLRKLEIRVHDLEARLQRVSDQHESALQRGHEVCNKAAAQIGEAECELLLLVQAVEAVLGQHPELDAAVARARKALGLDRESKEP